MPHLDKLREEHGVSTLDEALARRDQRAAEIEEVGTRVKEQIADIRRRIERDR